MKRLSISFILSIFLHVTAVVAITTMQLLQKPEKKKTKIMYIKPVKFSELRTLKPEPAKPKPLDKKIDSPQKKAIIKPKIAKKPVPTPTPSPVNTPLPVEKTPVPLPTKKPIIKKIDPKLAKLEKEQKAKVAFLRKQPYFKNWPEERLRRLELPPGMKSWEEAKALTDYFDKQYNWTMTPPELAGTEGRKLDHNPDVNPYVTPAPGETPVNIATGSPARTPVPGPTPTPEVNTAPNPEGTPIPWNIYQAGKPVPWDTFKENEKIEIYDIRFYRNNVGFIGAFNEQDMRILVSYFPFDPEKSKIDSEGNIMIEIPTNLKPGEIKSFILPLTSEDLQDKNNPDQYKYNKEQVVVTIIKMYKLLER